MKLLNKKIIIIDNSSLSYSGEDIDGTVVRGTEASLILLAEQFVKIGIKVDYCNSISNPKKINGVNYFHKNKIDKSYIYDLAIVISDANEFYRVSSIKKAVFSNSNQPIEKFIRKKQLLSYLKHRPIIATLGNYHLNNRNKLLRLFGNINLDIGIKENFFSTNIDCKKKIRLYLHLLVIEI